MGSGLSTKEYSLLKASQSEGSINPIVNDQMDAEHLSQRGLLKRTSQSSYYPTYEITEAGRRKLAEVEMGREATA